MQLLSLLPLLLPIATGAILPRAGGPALVPIPDTCTVSNPLADSASAANQTMKQLAPSAAVLASVLLYDSYIPLPDRTAIASRWEGCLQQCNGLSGCKAAFMADGIRTPRGYVGTTGGVRSRACLMFSRPLAKADFTQRKAVARGTVGNIICPA